MTDQPTRPYRIEIPVLIDDAGLSVYAFRLYAHVKRKAGDDGTCWESTRTLATACGMSVGQVGKARAELVAGGFVTQGVKHVRGGSVISLAIVSMWQENTERYGKCSPREHLESVHDTNTNDESVRVVNTNDESVHQVNAGVHTVNERRSIEEDPKSGANVSDDTPPAAEKPARKKRPTDPNQTHQGCRMFAELTGRNPNKIQAAAIVALVPDTESGAADWQRVVTDWLGRGWSSTNVNGMLDRYRKDSRNGRAQQQPQPVRQPVTRDANGHQWRAGSAANRNGSAARHLDGLPEVQRGDPAPRDDSQL